MNLRIAGYGMLLAVSYGAPLGAETMQLTFLEQERGIEPYQVRMLVNEAFLRIDDGPDADGFLLMRRADGMVYSVTHESKSVLDIPRHEVPVEPPIPVNPQEDYSAEPDAPLVGGKPVAAYRQHFNGETCFSAVVAEGLVPDVRAAMTELNKTLGGQQMQTLGNFPPESITACLLARLVYARQTFLERGFPVLEWDETGYRRQLLDFRPVDDLPADVFVIPEGYRHYEIGAGIPL